MITISVNGAATQFKGNELISEEQQAIAYLLEQIARFEKQDKDKREF